jgi:hypothetical protein
VGKLSPIIDLPSDLPKELQDKFRVEESQAVPVASPSPGEPGREGAALPPTEKESKKLKKVKPAQAARGAFTYPMRRLEKDPVVVGEKLVYDVTYFGVSAGSLTMEVLPHAQINQRKVYQIRGVARTSKFFEMFYRLNDTVETFMDYDGLFSHRFHLVLDESKQTRDALELYDSEKGQAYYWNRWNHYRKGFIENKEFKPISRFPQDSISVLYYMRSLPLAVGKKFKMPVVTEGNEWEAEIEVLRTEMEDTPMGTVRCLVMRPETRFQGVLKKTGESLFWVTDDDRRILVRVEAKVKIGAVVLKLKEASLGPK